MFLRIHHANLPARLVRNWRFFGGAASCVLFTGARGLQAMVDPSMVHGVDPAWLHQVFTGSCLFVYSRR